MDRVNQTTGDCFAAILQLRELEAEELPAPETLHQRMRGFLDDMTQKAAQSGFGPQDVQDMLYALAALADETALTKPEPLRSYWMGNLLQFHYFQENLAGDGFFARLTPLRNDIRRADVLRVYYLCLLFGFQGRYRVRGGELELMSLIDSVQHELFRGRQIEESLSPHGERPEEAARVGKRAFPVIGLSLAALGVAVFIFLGLKLVLSSNLHSTIQEIQALNQR